jgi:fatty acid/phospholipid biosynthesis enzyme
MTKTRSKTQIAYGLPVDGMGGDDAPGPILEGCLQAIERLPLKIRLVGEQDRVRAAAADLELEAILERAQASGHLELVPSGPPSAWMTKRQPFVENATQASMWRWTW